MVLRRKPSEVPYRSPSTWGRGGKASMCDYCVIDASTGAELYMTSDEEDALKQRKILGKDRAVRLIAMTPSGIVAAVFGFTKRSQRMSRMHGMLYRKILSRPREVLLGWRKAVLPNQGDG